MPLPLVSTRIGLSVTENPLPSENVRDIGELGSTPVVVTIMGVSGTGDVVEREFIESCPVGVVEIVTDAEPDLVVSSLLVAVTVTGFVVGTVAGAA
jgi:hypothetical protein